MHGQPPRAVWLGPFSDAVFPLDFQSPGLALPWLPAPTDTSHPHLGTQRPRPRQPSPNSGRAPSWTARPTRAPGAWWLSFWGAPATPSPPQSAPWMGPSSVRPCWTRCEPPVVGVDTDRLASQGPAGAVPVGRGSPGGPRGGRWPLPRGSQSIVSLGDTRPAQPSHTEDCPSVQCAPGFVRHVGSRTDQPHKKPRAGDCRVMKMRSVSSPGFSPIWFPMWTEGAWRMRLLSLPWAPLCPRG